MYSNTTILICIIFLFALSGTIIFLWIRLNYFRNLSETDRMTSLMNYNGICRKIENFKKHKIPFSLVIIDIDNFGIFNKHSYKLGDDVLKEFSLLLKNSLPENALLARFRIGDEFIIVFQNKNLHEAKKEIDKFKTFCKKYNFSSLKYFSIHSINFSEGYSEFHSNFNSLANIFSEAEIFLKKNKMEKSLIFN